MYVVTEIDQSGRTKVLGVVSTPESWEKSVTKFNEHWPAHPIRHKGGLLWGLDYDKILWELILVEPIDSLITPLKD